MLEDIPRHGPQLAADLRRIGVEIKRQAEKELTELYPTDPDGATPIAYLWARTVQCEAPNCGAEIPLVRSFWLCKKAHRRRALKPLVELPTGEPPRVAFEVYEPKAEQDVPAGTVTRARAICPCCSTVLPPERVRAQLSSQRGGAEVIFDAQGRRTGGARLLAVVTLKLGEQGRQYRLATERDYDAIRQAQECVAKMLTEWERGGKQGLCPVPDELMNPIRPSPNARGLSAVTRYGMLAFGDLFTARQKVTLVTLAQLVRERPVSDDGAVREGVAIVVNRCADRQSTVCRLDTSRDTIANTYARQALPMIWDFCEGNPFSDSTGGYEGALDWAAKVTDAWLGSRPGQLQLADATEHPLPDETAGVWFTDPPYYDAIPYADLSDFFLVWRLKRSLPFNPLLRDPFNPENALTPKLRECVWNRAYSYEGRPKDKPFFEETMSKAFKEGRRILSQDGIGSVVFAHQTTEGWEAFLGGLVGAGWTVTASWPITTEMASRIRARENASLATSVHLVCRPRPDDAPLGDWGEVLRELPWRVGDWMERLQAEGVRGADLVFACIGPALEIFSRYTKVETAEGQEVTLSEYLEKVWEVVGRTALEQVLGSGEARARNGAAGALEEDARLTALFLWTLQSTNGQGNGSAVATEAEEADDLDEAEEEAPRSKPKSFSLVFDVVRRFAQPLGIHLPAWEDRIIETKKGVVRLMTVTERAQQLFGDTGAQAIADQLEHGTAGTAQLTLFPDSPTGAVARVRGRSRRRSGPVDVADESLSTQRGATTLDRVHAAMLLQSSGRTNALRALLAAEEDRGPDFLRLANALSALYPRGSEEKRLLDAMLLAVPR
jgi:adenine-specific DNA methylase